MAVSRMGRLAVAGAIVVAVLVAWTILRNTDMSLLGTGLVAALSLVLAGWMWDDAKAAGRSPWPWMVFALPGALLALDVVFLTIGDWLGLPAPWFGAVTGAAYLVLALGVGALLVVRELRLRAS